LWNERKKDSLYRFCTQCEIFKPDRTHHCRVCNQCILRMDHHCPWIANCVGFMNYKFFLLFVFYGVASAIFVMATMFGRLLQAFGPVLDWGQFFLRDFPVVLAFLACLFLSIALGIFFSFHFFLTMSAMSTIELREKKNVQETKHRFNVAHMKFDRGTYGNVVHVLGPIYMWLFPIQPHEEFDGTYCPVDLQLDSVPDAAKSSDALATQYRSTIEHAEERQESQPEQPKQRLGGEHEREQEQEHDHEYEDDRDHEHEDERAQHEPHNEGDRLLNTRTDSVSVSVDSSGPAGSSF